MIIREDTIIALATPSGVGAIAVIRISGKDAVKIVSRFFKSVNNKDLIKQKTHTIHLGNIVVDGVVLDQVLVSLFRNPNSYTGEDIVEISCHGSEFIQREIIKLFLKNGCRMAEKGEFTLRAFINGKMDLSQAEAVADLIASNSATSHSLAMQQMRSGVSSRLTELREELLNFASMIELELDFSGEDVEFADRKELKTSIEKLIDILKKLIESFSVGNAMKNGIPVAIIGKPNVGKSTLLNTLLDEEKAIVSNIAGTTRDAIEDQVIIAGTVFRFIDTAGIRDTQNTIENLGIQKTLEKAKSAQLILYLIDVITVNSSETLLKEIEDIKKEFPDKQLIIIANKIDALSLEKRKVISEEVKGLLLLSAKEKIGVKSLIGELSNLASRGKVSNNEGIITNARHFEALSKALENAIEVQKNIKAKIPSDLLSIDIRQCLYYLSSITGDYDVGEAILANIFGKFCIGK